MKFRLYVMNMSGISRQSILRKTRFASACSSLITSTCSGDMDVAALRIRFEAFMAYGGVENVR